MLQRRTKVRDSLFKSYPSCSLSSHLLLSSPFEAFLLNLSLCSSLISLPSQTLLLSLSLYPDVSHRGRQTSVALGKCFAVGRSLGFNWL